MITGTIAHGLRCKGYAYHANRNSQGQMLKETCVEDTQEGWAYWEDGEYWEEGKHNKKWVDAEGSLSVSGLSTW